MNARADTVEAGPAPSAASARPLWPTPRDAFLSAWAAAEPEAARGAWERDLQTYLDHERVKSVVVDAVRYAKILAEGQRGPDAERALVDSLVGKLELARAVWGQPDPVDPEQVERALRDWH